MYTLIIGGSVAAILIVVAIEIYSDFKRKKNLKRTLACPHCGKTVTIQLEEQVMDIQESLYVLGYTATCPNCSFDMQYKDLP